MQKTNLFALGVFALSGLMGFMLGVASGCSSEDRGTEQASRNSDLIHAAYNNDITSIKALLREQADIDAPDSDGNTSLMIAVKRGHIDSVRLLLERNANVNYNNKAGQSGLMLAMRQGQSSIGRMLIEAGALMNTQDTEGQSTLHYATLSGNQDSLALIVNREQGLINHQDHMGNTALMLAALHGYELLVKTLLQSGADTGIRNSLNQTALSLAQENGHNRVIYLLER